MSSRSTCLTAGSILALFCLLAVPATARAQDSKSSTIAHELAQQMAALKLDSIAARNPAGNNEYVAALYFPGQLLVVSAQYSAPALLDQKLDRREYRDIYVDLNSASIAETKVLITDLGADGLRARRDDNQPFDARDAGGKTFQFDGNWKEDKLSEEEYMKAFATADDAYAKALTVLLGALKQ